MDVLAGLYHVVSYWVLVVGWILIGILTLIQIGWMSYRWISDAETEWEGERRDRDVFWCTPNIKCLEGYNTPILFFVIMVISVIAVGIAALLWCVVLPGLALFIAAHTMRWALRFKRKVNKILSNKADVDHNHDDVYVHADDKDVQV